jgi:hypothetical protein
LSFILAWLQILYGDYACLMNETSIHCISNVPKTRFKYILVPKLIGSKVVRLTIIYKTNSTWICAYLLVRFEYHAHLSHLGFYGVSHIYWIKESKKNTMVIILKIWIYKAFKIHMRYHLEKTLGDTRRHKSVWQNTFVDQIISKKQINKWFILRVQHMN